MAWTIGEGTARAAIYPEGPNGEPWVPHHDQHDTIEGLPHDGPSVAQVLQIKWVEEVGSCGAQSTHVLVKANSLKELVKAVAHVKERLARMFAKCQ